VAVRREANHPPMTPHGEPPPTLDRALAELRIWLEDNWAPSLPLRSWWQRLGVAGWARPHWPLEWFGRGLAAADSFAVGQAIRGFGGVAGPAGFGTNMVAPTLLAHGDDEQKARHLEGIVTGVDAYCQLFSEPNLPASKRGRTATVTPGSSTGRRSGLPAPGSQTRRSCSPGPMRMSRSTSASRILSSTSPSQALRSGRCGR